MVNQRSMVLVECGGGVQTSTFYEVIENCVAPHPTIFSRLLPNSSPFFLTLKSSYIISLYRQKEAVTTGHEEKIRRGSALSHLTSFLNKTRIRIKYALKSAPSKASLRRVSLLEYCNFEDFQVFQTPLFGNREIVTVERRK